MKKKKTNLTFFFPTHLMIDFRSTFFCLPLKCHENCSTMIWNKSNAQFVSLFKHCNWKLAFHNAWHSQLYTKTCSNYRWWEREKTHTFRLSRSWLKIVTRIGCFFFMMENRRFFCGVFFFQWVFSSVDQEFDSFCLQDWANQN